MMSNKVTVLQSGTVYIMFKNINNLITIRKLLIKYHRNYTFALYELV